MLAIRKLVAFVGATITLAVLTSCRADEFETPDLEVFANYEDMQRYITARSQRTMRCIDNPTHDSYINAYNDHHELDSLERVRRATKEQQLRKLPNEPKMVRFEIEDAVEPSAEVKELIRQHRSREEHLEGGAPAEGKGMHKSVERAKPQTTTSAPKRTTRATRKRVARSKRPKRAAITSETPNKQQYNFQVKLIPFDISEAREPDEETKALIRRMRNLELEKYRKEAATSTAAPTKIRVNRNAPAPTATQPLTVPVPSFNPANYYRPKTGKFFMKRKGKRVKRSAPEMISFGVEDARQPDAATMEHLRLARQNYELANEQRSRGEDKTGTVSKREARMDSRASHSADQQKVQPVREEVDEDSSSDLSSGESKRMYIYNKVPAGKAKKSMGSLPTEVQKIITNLMKDHSAGKGAAGAGKGANGNGAKAYLKYIPAQKSEYSQLKSLYGAKIALPTTYSIGGPEKLSPASYVKYTPSNQKAEQMQVQLHQVPVVEKLRYIYTPVASVGHGYMSGAVGHAEEQAAVQAAAVQAAYAEQNRQAVAEAQAAQAAKAAHEAQAARAAHEAQAAAQFQDGGGYSVKIEGGSGQEGGAMSYPIIVQEGTGQNAPTQVYHKYAAGVSYAYEEDMPVAIAIKAMNFKPSKPDPMLNENKVLDAGEKAEYSGAYEFKAFGGDNQQAAAGSAKEVESNEQKYKYEVEVEDAAEPEKEADAPLVKIEYHGPADTIKQNFKELPEFKQLSTLVGKSTEDQIHGLTYLLAKEMQNKLKSQRRKLPAGESQGDQTRTSPILFPIQDHQQGGDAKKQEQASANDDSMQGRLIGMAKSKEYIPIVEQSPAAEPKAAASVGGGVKAVGGEYGYTIPAGAKQNNAEPKAPLPNSFVSYGLSPNYKIIKGGEGGGGGGMSYGAQKTKLIVDQIIHHPTPNYKSYGGGSSRAEYAKALAAEAEKLPVGASSEQSLSFGDEMQYASKYAFGYRIRDFHTGNDFGHKQNRDLDGVTRGQYHILLPDGRIQNVIYHADDTGFHADVSFETGH